MIQSIKKYIPIFLLSLLLIGCDQALQSESLPENWEVGQVLRTVDGDTLVVNIDGKETRVRMIGINTPESVHPSGIVEYYGQESSDFTKEQLTGRTIYLESDVSPEDQYQRALRYIWLGLPQSTSPTQEEFDKLFYNGILVKRGYAREIIYEPNTKHQDILYRYEQEAIRGQKGLWNSDYGTKEAPVTPKIQSDNRTESTLKTNPEEQKIKGNKKSKIYHMPTDPDYNKMNEQNVVYFDSEKEAEAAGFRRAGNK